MFEIILWRISFRNEIVNIHFFIAINFIIRFFMIILTRSFFIAEFI